MTTLPTAHLLPVPAAVRPGSRAGGADPGVKASLPVWFGPVRSRLFGLLHAPGEEARAAVVLCHPLGREHSCAYGTYVRLAEALAARGFIVLRFDYRSTGDSSERSSPSARTSLLLEDVAHAVTFVRGLGDLPVSLVGMRAGALLAAIGGGPVAPDAMVLWDPCRTGRAFVREQRALSLGVPPSCGVKPSDGIPGSHLPRAMLHELATLEMRAGAGSTARKVLLVTRESQRAEDRRLLAVLAAASLEHRRARGQEELLDVPTPEQAVPMVTVASIAGWLDGVSRTERSRLVLPSTDSVLLTVAVGPEAPPAQPIRERALRLGPSSLFGISAAPSDPPAGPTAIFVSVANEHRIGPNRLWVDLSRRLASRGLRTLRLDLGGAGDSLARADGAAYDVFSYAAVEEILEAAAMISPEDPSDVILFGLCSSANHVLEAAARLRPRGVVAVNPIVSFPVPATDDDTVHRQFLLPSSATASAGRKARSLGWLESRAPGLRILRLRLPGLSLRLRHAVRRADSVGGRPFRRLAWTIGEWRDASRGGPARHLAELARVGSDVVLICGAEEMRPFRHAVDLVGTLPAGALRVELEPGLDHALRRPWDRERVSDIVVEHLDALLRSPARS